MKNLALTMIALAGLAQAAAAQDLPVEVRITGETTVGSTITVEILTGAPWNIIAADIPLVYDPAILEPVGTSPWTAGEVWFGSVWEVINEVNADNPFTEYCAVDLGLETMREAGVFASIQFKIIGTGTCTFSFPDDYLNAPAFIDQTNNTIPVVLTTATFSNEHTIQLDVVTQANIGQTVTLTAIVGSEYVDFTGHVEFEAGGVNLSTVPVSVLMGGTSQVTAGWNTAGLLPGVHQVTARLQGTTISSTLPVLLKVPPVFVPETEGDAGSAGCSVGSGTANLAPVAAAVLLLALLRWFR